MALLNSLIHICFVYFPGYKLLASRENIAASPSLLSV